MIEADAVPAIMDDLRRVSDDWLNAKAGAEKGFSMGFFDEAYLSRFPVAVIERAGRIVAFANMWLGPDGEEMCVDLMRYHRDAPTSVMEALFVHLFGWGKAQGYHWFALGMAPLSGFEPSPVAPLWSRLGVVSLQARRSAVSLPGAARLQREVQSRVGAALSRVSRGLRLPRILADVSALIAGGYRRIFVK